MESLQQQQREIDNPNTPTVKAIDVDIDALQNSFTGVVPFTNAKTQEAAMGVSSRMSPQIQGEFANWDPSLDEGIMSGDDQNEIRAGNQGFWGETGAGLFQVANELVLGTAEATALMVDLGMHTRALQGTEQEFSNSLSRAIGEVKDSLNAKYGKVYVSKDNKGFNPGSYEFWMNNAGNVATAVTLMIPSMGAVKGLSAIAKASKLARVARMSNSAKAATKGITAAIISRFGENAMEAAEAVEATKASFYNEDGTVKINPATNAAFTEEEINKASGEAGVNTWRGNWPLVAIDMFQYGKAFRGIDYARRTMENGIKKSIASKVGSFIVKDMGSEGAEEGYQYITSQESQYGAKTRSGLMEDDSSFWSRLSDYVTNDEFKTGVLLGTVGGGVFAGAGAYNSYKETKNQLAERLRLEDIHSQNDAAITKNPEKFAQIEDLSIITNAIEKASNGDLDLMEADLTDLQNEPDSELEALGINPTEYRTKVSRAKDLVKEVASEYNKVMNESLPRELLTSTLYTRLDRKISERHVAELANARNEVFASDKSIFEAKESTTADMMVRLKTLLYNKNNEKAEKLAEEIADASNVYKDKGDVYASLNTSNDVEIKRLDALEKLVQTRIEAAKQYEQDLRTEEGIAKILDRVRKEQAKKEKAKAAKAKRDAAQQNAESEVITDLEDTILDSENLSKEIVQYRKDRDVRKKELEAKGIQEYKTGEPDGDKVFTTFNNKHQRTWVKGEVVRDSKGNKYRVLGPTAKPYAARLMPLDKQGNNKKGVDPVLSYKVEGLSFESLKPGRKDIDTEWTINKVYYDDIKTRHKEEVKEATVTEDIVKGIIKTVNSEFANFKPNSKRRWVFDGDAPETRTDHWFPIDFDKAAEPMTQGESQEVDLVAESYGGRDVIVVKQNGVAISKMSEKDRQGQHDKLVEFIKGKGGTIKATLKSKYVSFQSNLGTIPGSRTNISVFEGTKHLPNGKVYIGSRKPNDTELQFTSTDGDYITLPISDKQAETARTGNTYILFMTPSGDMVPIQLNESSLGEVTTKEGVTYAEDTMNKLDSAAAILTARLNELVNKLMTEGTVSGAVISTREQAIERAKKILGLAKSDEVRTEKSEAQEAIDSIINPVTRLIDGQKILDSEGNPVKNKEGYELKRITKNFFNVAFKYNAETQYVEPRITTSKENPDKGSTSEFLKDVATTREAAIEKLGSRFMVTSLDIMNSPEGKDYVSTMVKEQWFTTDLYAKRPWVNPRLNIQLDNEATIYTSEGTKAKPKKRDFTSSKPKSKKEKAELETSENINEDRLKEANKAVLKITDVLTPEELDKKKAKNQVYTVEDFISEYLQGLTTVNKFNDLASEVVRDIRSKETGPDKMRHQAVWRQAYKEVTKELLSKNEVIEKVEDLQPIVTEIQSISSTDKEKSTSKQIIKPETLELFESNPELSNAVYEALGFNVGADVTINSIIQSIPEIIEVEYTNDLPINIGGRFKIGGDIPIGKGKILINSTLDKVSQEESLAHELVHGILRLRYKEKLDPDPKIKHKNIGSKYEYFYATYNSYGARLGKRFNTMEEAESYIKEAKFTEVNFKGSELEKELKSIWKTVPKNKINPILIDYINKNIEELITYSLTNKEFAKILNSIQYNGEVEEYKGKSIFQVIIDLFSKIVPVKGSAYAKVLSTLNKYANNVSIENQITSQQEEITQQKFKKYVETTGRQDIEGFKKYINLPISTDTVENPNSNKAKFNKPVKPSKQQEVSTSAVTSKKGVSPEPQINSTALDSLLNDLENADKSLPSQTVDKVREEVKKGKIRINCK